MKVPAAVHYLAVVLLEIAVVAMAVNEGIDAAAVFLMGIVLALMLGLNLGGSRGGALSADRTPTRPPATPRLVPIGGCQECGAGIGGGHTGRCSKSKMRGGPGGVVTEADCRSLTVGDIGMG